MRAAGVRGLTRAVQIKGLESMSYDLYPEAAQENRKRLRFLLDNINYLLDKFAQDICLGVRLC
jgi:hypothetical protein